MEPMSHDQVSWLSVFLGDGAPRITSRLPGLYRATVVSTDDPLQRGHIQVIVTERSETACWATPCRTAGTSDEPPAAGSAGWVRFERADPDLPVWMGTLPG